MSKKKSKKKVVHDFQFISQWKYNHDGEILFDLFSFQRSKEDDWGSVEFTLLNFRFIWEWEK